MGDVLHESLLSYKCQLNLSKTRRIFVASEVICKNRPFFPHILYMLYFLSTTSVMGTSVFQLLCLTEFFVLVLSHPYAYYLVEQGKNWSDALTFCRANYIDLAIIKSQDDMIMLQNKAQLQKFTSSAWIALYNDINSWRWSMGNQPRGNFTDWCSNEPSLGLEGCAALSQSCWLDVPCGRSYPFVCFDDRNDGSSRYITISKSLSFRGAQSYCRTHHTDLASARDEEENTIVKKAVASTSWFGLFRDVWKWSDQSNFSAIPWSSGQPPSSGQTVNCGKFINGQVAAAECSEIMPFFCLANIQKRQTIKMKVKSSQDVNDPAVKAAILQKIMEKMKEHGMAENITIKWKQQPDGLVFHKIENNTGI